MTTRWWLAWREVGAYSRYGIALRRNHPALHSQVKAATLLLPADPGYRAPPGSPACCTTAWLGSAFRYGYYTPLLSSCCAATCVLLGACWMVFGPCYLLQDIAMLSLYSPLQYYEERFWTVTHTCGYYL